MLDRILFWAVLVWMIGMLVMAFVAVREVWRDSNRPTDDDAPDPSAKDTQQAGGEKSSGA